MSEHDVVIQLTLVMVLGVGAQWLAWRLHFPSILLLLLCGLAVGPGAEWATGEKLLEADGLFGRLLLPLTSFAVGIILYEGGLSLRLREIAAVRQVVWRLVTLGALTTWMAATFCAWGIGLLRFDLALLLGAILIVTGPTVVSPLLRHIRPHGQVGPILKWEGIMTDPIGAILAVLVFEVILAGTIEQGLTAAVLGFFKAALIGTSLGILGGGVLILLHRRHWLPEHLENPVSLMILVFTFTAANLGQEESGLITATVMGVLIGNVMGEEADSIIEFKENLQVLLIATLFVVLSARLGIADLQAALGWKPILFLVLLVVVVRPLAVAVSTNALPTRERLFMAWMAPRGIVAAAVASVFALRLAEAHHPQAQDLASITFLVIIGTVALYGLTATRVARRLGLAEPSPTGLLILSAAPWVRSFAKAVQQAGVQVKLIDSNRTNTRAARMAGLEAVHANVLSHYAAEDLDLGGIGRFAALTPNDEVNTLAAERFRPELGRANVFQLFPPAKGQRRHDASVGAKSRYVFGEGVDHRVIEDRMLAGWVIKATRLSPAFSFERWRELYGREAIPLAVVQNHRLLLFAHDLSPEPRAGDTLVSLVLPSGSDESQRLKIVE